MQTIITVVIILFGIQKGEPANSALATFFLYRGRSRTQIRPSLCMKIKSLAPTEALSLLP